MASFCSHCCIGTGIRIRIRRARHWHAPKKKRDGRSTCQLIAPLVASCRQALLPPSLVYVYLLVWCCAYVHVYVHVPMIVAGVVDVFVTLKSGRFCFLCSLHARTKGTSTARGCTVHMPDVRECRGPLHVSLFFFFRDK